MSNLIPGQTEVKETADSAEITKAELTVSDTEKNTKALFENSDNVFDRGETVLDDEDETEDTDEDRV